MVGLHFGVHQTQKDRESESLTEISEEQASKTRGREGFCSGLLALHCLQQINMHEPFLKNVLKDLLCIMVSR